jgi:hypothetical protein
MNAAWPIDGSWSEFGQNLLYIFHVFLHVIDFLGYMLSQILDTGMGFLEEVGVAKVVSKLEKR